MESSDLLLDIQDLTVAFETSEGEVHAVNGVSFSVGRGETVGLVGESGCGKSVTALSILRLLPVPPARIVKGEIRFKEKELFKLSERAMRTLRGRSIAMVFQDPMTSLNPVFRVGYQIREMLQAHFPAMSKAEIEERTLRGLEMVGIPSPETRLKAYPHELSGGMRQRVMIAMALACEPELLIADEPTTALDVTIQAQILDLIQTIQERMGLSVLLITHDLGIVAQTTQRVVVMYAGQVVEMAPTRELFRNPRHPYTKGLLNSLPGRYMEIKGKRYLPSIPGMVPSLLELPRGCPFLDRCGQALEVCASGPPPETIDAETDHRVRCWRFLKGKENRNGLQCSA